MKTQHTPGPWSATEIHPDNGRVMIGSPKDFICEMYRYPEDGGEDQNQSEQEANAALIASAPDLLKERDELREALRKNGVTDSVPYEPYNSELSGERDVISELKSLNAELLEALKDVSATRGLAMKHSPSEVETRELIETFERVKSAIAKAEGRASA